MNASLLNFTIQFDLATSPNRLILTDTTPWVAQGIALSKVDGVFVLESEVGIFHSNTNYASPDIDGNTGVMIFNHNLPLDSDGVVLTGDYTLKYSAKVTAEQFTYSVISVDQTADTFGISGNYIDDILNAVGGTIAITGSTGNTGTYTVNSISCSYDAVNDITYVGVTTNIPDATADGLLRFTCDKIYTLTQTQNYCFVEPSVDIEVTSSCVTSTLVSTDNSTYMATSCGTSLAPSSISRVHTVVYPTNPTTGSPVNANYVTSNDTATITPIWTETFQITITTTLVYVLSTGVTLTVVVTGYQAHDVKCDEGLCCAYDCIYNLYQSYLEAKKQNFAEATKYQNLLIKVISEWMLYSIAVGCGNTDDATAELENLIDLVKSANCNCCNEPSNAPVQVVPLLTAGGGSGNTYVVTTCGNGITVTATTVGTTTTYQVCLDTTVLNGYINTQIAAQSLFDHTDTVQLALVNKQVLMYNSTTGVWNNVLLGMTHISDIDLITNPPAAGYILTYNAVTHKAEFLPKSFKNVLVNDIGNVGTDANIIEKTLKEYTIPGGTLVSNGDFIKVEFYMNFIQSDFEKTIYLYFGAAPSLIYNSVIYKDTLLKAEINIVRVSPTTGILESVGYFNTLPAKVIGYTYFTFTETWANNLVIRVSGKNSFALANSIVCKYLRATVNYI